MWLSWGLFIYVFAGLSSPVPAHVVSRFGDVQVCLDFFMDNYTPQLPGVVVNDTIQDQNRFRPVCQYFQNKYRYATLYDTQNRIPVFSAYVYNGSGEKSCRPKKWFVEPQLDGRNVIDMSPENSGMSYDNQARDEDYRNNTQGVNRGHILPKCHAYLRSDATSTFTLTNVVPQVISFNNGSWCKMENYVKRLMDKSCRDNNNATRAYVVTGAVPDKGKFLNNRVNIPSLMWTAFCCYDITKQSWMSVAHWGLNKGENDKNKTIPPGSLRELYSVLGDHYPQMSIFPNKCLSVTESESLSSSNLTEAAADEEAGGCSCDENDEPCAEDPTGNGPGMFYGGTRQHTLLVFSVSAIFILKHLH